MIARPLASRESCLRYGKGHFSTDEAAFKVIYLAVVAAEKRWTRTPKGWAQAINQLALHLRADCPSEACGVSANRKNRTLSFASPPLQDPSFIVGVSTPTLCGGSTQRAYDPFSNSARRWTR